MEISLPYRFQTDVTGKIILKGMVGLQALLALGIIKTLFIYPSLLNTMGIVVLLLFVSLFGVTVFKKLGGATGIITEREVTVTPTSLFGITSASPGGCFTITQFSQVRIEMIPFPAAPGSGSYERVYLQGIKGVEDLLIARTNRNNGITFGRQLGKLLHLPVTEETKVY